MILAQVIYSEILTCNMKQNDVVMKISFGDFFPFETTLLKSKIKYSKKEIVYLMNLYKRCPKTIYISTILELVMHAFDVQDVRYFLKKIKSVTLVPIQFPVVSYSDLVNLTHSIHMYHSRLAYISYKYSKIKIDPLLVKRLTFFKLKVVLLFVKVTKAELSSLVRVIQSY